MDDVLDLEWRLQQKDDPDCKEGARQIRKLRDCLVALRNDAATWDSKCAAIVRSKCNAALEQ